MYDDCIPRFLIKPYRRGCKGLQADGSVGYELSPFASIFVLCDRWPLLCWNQIFSKRNSSMAVTKTSVNHDRITLK